MGSRFRKRQARRVHRHLSVEQLESREMMAADLLAAPLGVASENATAVSPAITTESASRSNRIPRSTPPAPTTPALVPTRTFDGTGNNLANPELGSTDEQLKRVAEASYDKDGYSMNYEDRPNPRDISNALVAHAEEATPNDRKLTAYIYIWGQFLDHDIDLTEPPANATDREAANIQVPMGDAYFDPDSTDAQWMAFNRSRYDAATGTGADNPRQQINQITAWIDGSMIYGSNTATADSLRTFSGGKLKTSDGLLPPTDAAGNFLAGDTRANENIELTSMHALFVREHNWWAAKIAKENPSLSDEAIFQQARAIIGAEIQAITFNEFLPALLGTNAIKAYRGYNASVDPTIANEFSTAAFRLGHSLINDDVEFFGNDGRAVRDEIALKEAFFNPSLLRETGIEGILKYAASTKSEELDNQIVDSLRNFLFGAPGQGGLDLASLNIQRGRDHGLADYNSVREAYGLKRVTSFAEITSNVESQETLRELYGDSLDNIDLWVGALAEDHTAGAPVGLLVSKIVADQFQRLRDGDRFWYENVFSGRQLTQLRQTTLAGVIERNTGVNNLQSNVFFFKAQISGQVFLDTDGNGSLGRREAALPLMTVELLNDEGEVVATTRTGRDGRYQFDQFGETGDYQVRIVVPASLSLTSTNPQAILISAGDLNVRGVNFGLRSSRIRSPRTDGLVVTTPSTRLPVVMNQPNSQPTGVRTMREVQADLTAATAFEQLGKIDRGFNSSNTIDDLMLRAGSRTPADVDAVHAEQGADVSHGSARADAARVAAMRVRGPR